MNAPPEHFNSWYGQTPPWDIGEPQPALLALLDEYPPKGPVLDAGCGTGALALALAERGLAVLGVDSAEAAIAQAEAKAAAAAPDVRRLVEFRVGDALHPASLPGPFGAVVDSGFFHLFGPDERERFALELAAALADGGRYYLLGFAIASPIPTAPRQVLESELRALFAAERGWPAGHLSDAGPVSAGRPPEALSVAAGRLGGWRILALRPARFVIRSARGNEVPALAACIERVKANEDLRGFQKTSKV